MRNSFSKVELGILSKKMLSEYTINLRKDINNVIRQSDFIDFFITPDYNLKDKRSVKNYKTLIDKIFNT